MTSKAATGQLVVPQSNQSCRISGLSPRRELTVLKSFGLAHNPRYSPPAEVRLCTVVFKGFQSSTDQIRCRHLDSAQGKRRCFLRSLPRSRLSGLVKTRLAISDIPASQGAIARGAKRLQCLIQGYEIVHRDNFYMNSAGNRSDTRCFEMMYFVSNSDSRHLLDWEETLDQVDPSAM